MKFSTLLVEDNDDDAFLFERAFRKCFPDATIARVSDGESLVKYLRGSGDYGVRSRFPMPDFVVLDLVLPGMQGFEILEWRRTSEFCLMPFVVFSSVAAHLEKAASLGVQRVFFKVAGMGQLREAVTQICEAGLQRGNSGGPPISEMRPLPPRDAP